MSLKPPFTQATAHQKVKAAQALWNTQNPEAIAKAYTPTSTWRNRSTFLSGHASIIAFLTEKWAREKSYRLRKELFSFHDNRIAVQFWYEYQDAKRDLAWTRCYGIEHWTFAEDGRMEKRVMSGNDVRVGQRGRGGERWFGNDVKDVDSVDIEKRDERRRKFTNMERTFEGAVVAKQENSADGSLVDTPSSGLPERGAPTLMAKSQLDAG